jgi:hypothetical protein
MARGPKIHTPMNSAKPVVLPGPAAPVSPLTRRAKREFTRLVALLRRRGTLDRVDIGHVTELARIKAMLDVEHGKAAPDIKAIALLTGVKRGLARELSLTLQPSRANFRVSGGQSSEPLASMREKLKGG